MKAGGRGPAGSAGGRIKIKAGRVLDPATGTDTVKDILIEDGRIVDSFTVKADVETIDAAGMVVTPGLIDMHVHLREPGREDEETIKTGAKAAAAGGFTTVVCMPNTNPPIDNRAIVEYLTDQAERALVKVKVVGAITAGLAGAGLADMGDLAQAGVVAFSDDGRPVSDSGLMRRALEYSLVFGLPVISHAEDLGLSNNGVMNEGLPATRLGLRGIPGAAEEAMAARDIILAGLTGARLHLTHVSTAGTVDLIRQAKKRGIKVTADVTPHHLTLTDELLNSFNTNLKMNPPLRSERDTQALADGLLDGTIDAIASDHAPHAAYEKDGEFEVAPFGVTGLQTTLPALLTFLSDKLDLQVLIGKLTLGPACILGLEAGSLAPGLPADVTMINIKAKVKVDSEFLLSKSKNSAYYGSELTGAADTVIVNGRVVCRGGELVK